MEMREKFFLFSFPFRNGVREDTRTRSNKKTVVIEKRLRIWTWQNGFPMRDEEDEKDMKMILLRKSFKKTKNQNKVVKNNHYFTL